MEGVNGHDNTNRNQVKSQANPSIVKLCVGYSDLTFRILVSEIQSNVLFLKLC